MQRTAIIVYHKQATSARTRFLRGSGGCLFYADCVEGAAAHPAGLMREIAEDIGLAPAELVLDNEFRPPQSELGSIYLVRVTTIDPPDTGPLDDYRFVSLLDARDLPEAELELLGAAYRSVLGG